MEPTEHLLSDGCDPRRREQALRFPVRLYLRPSRRIVHLLCLIHGVTALSFLASSLGVLGRTVGIFAVLLNLGFAIRRIRKTLPTQLVLEENGNLRCADQEGLPEESCTLAGSCRDLGWAVWLKWHEHSGPRRHVMLLPDMLEDGEAWRFLRIWLGHKVAGAVLSKASAAGGSDAG